MTTDSLERSVKQPPRRAPTSALRKTARQLWRHRWLYVMLLPGLLFFGVFVYWPHLGSVVAFQDYSPFLGFEDSPWVGLKHFRRMFADPEVWRVTWNTLYLNFLGLGFGFPLAIILAVMIYEAKNKLFKRFVQTAVFVPYFISLVVIVGIWYQLFGSSGLVNEALVSLGANKISFMTSPDWFRFNYVAQSIWKNTGYNTIIYLAALAGVSSELHDAAAIDGASRLQRIWHVTLPAIRPVIVILFILSLGHILSVGFEHVFLLLNASNDLTAQVIDTFVYYRGVAAGNFSFATAVGLIKGVVALVLVLTANHAVRRFTGKGAF